MLSNFANIKTLSPRLNLAATLYATGAAGTKREASRLAGLHPHYLTMMTNYNEPTKRLVNQLRERILNESIDASVLLRTMGRKALARLDELVDSSNEHVALKAAIDLADRSPEASKTQRLEVTSLTLGSDDARELAKALVEASGATERHREVITSGLVEVMDTTTVEAGKEGAPNV
jgi:hypothetical protein